MQGNPITDKQKEAFLDALRQNPNVTLAADAISVSRVAMYTLRKADDAFAAAWDDALAEGADRLEAEIWRRGVDGVREPVIGRVGKDQDGIITHVQKYSDTLAALLIKAHKPDKYRERAPKINLNLTVQELTQMDDSALDALIERLSRS